MRKIWVFLGVLGVVCTSAVFAGPPIARNIAPQFFLARAAYNTASEFMPLIESASLLVPQIQNSALRNEFTLNIGRIENGIADHIPPSIRAAIPMMALRGAVLWDDSRDIFNLNLSLQAAVTTLADADLYMQHNQIALYAPMFFGRPIVADPSRLGSEWAASPISGIFDIWIDDAIFYHYYSMLFAYVKEVDIAVFRDDIMSTIRDAQIEYLGRNDDGLYVYRVVGSAFEATAFEATVYVNGNRLAAVYFDEFAIRFPKARRMEFDFPHLTIGNIITAKFDGSRGNMTSAESEGSRGNMASAESEGTRGNMTSAESEGTRGHMTFAESGGHQLIDFDISFDDMEAAGELRIVPDAWRIEADINRLNISLHDLNLSLGARVSVMPDAEEIVFDGTGARNLADLNIFDINLLGLLESPLGGMLGGILP